MFISHVSTLKRERENLRHWLRVVFTAFGFHRRCPRSQKRVDLKKSMRNRIGNLQTQKE